MISTNHSHGHLTAGRSNLKVRPKKYYAFSRALNDLNESQTRTSDGRAFQVEGAAELDARDARLFVSME